jgi:hypothetical protein
MRINLLRTINVFRALSKLISIKTRFPHCGRMSWRSIRRRLNLTKLPYLRTMFATCMLFQVIYVLCVVLWLAFPDPNGHALLLAVFPNFKLLTVGSFIYGFIASMVYGWIAAIIFVFFFNLWPQLTAAVVGRRAVRASQL